MEVYGLFRCEKCQWARQNQPVIYSFPAPAARLMPEIKKLSFRQDLPYA